MCNLKKIISRNFPFPDFSSTEDAIQQTFSIVAEFRNSNRILGKFLPALDTINVTLNDQQLETNGATHDVQKW